jgi:DNA-binding response OmpR family regulator
MISLRQALVREGMVVSMAWDGAQAMELLGTRHPEVVVVDLALPERAGYVLVAQLAACDPPPVTVLVPDEEEAAEAFATVLPELAPVSRLVPLADLLVRALGQ